VALKNNPNITEHSLKKLHKGLLQWSVFCADFDHDLAKEILQKSYLKVLDGRAAFDKKSSLKTWLFAVIRFTALEANRKGSVELVNWDSAEIENDHQSEEIPEFSNEHYTIEMIDEALKALSRGQREIVYLAFYKDLSLNEISQVLDIGIGSVRTQYHRAKVNLKVLLTEAENNVESAGVRYEKQYS
jgi:RNA polymerase sigma factor (sigma-70 family)